MSGAPNAAIRPWSALHRLALAIALTLVANVSITTHAADDRLVHDELIQFEEKWAKALEANDVEQIASLLCDEFILVGPQGIEQTRDEYLDSLRGGAWQIETIELGRASVRFAENSAVVSTPVMVSGRHAAREYSGPYQFTDTLVRTAEGWRALARQQAPAAFDAGSLANLNDRTEPARRKPGVILFVQGAFCVHCIAQLEEFARQLDERQIDVTVVSAAGKQDLARFPALPFRLIADSNYSLFRAVGAFDKGPLHATLAVNGQGSVVFRAIGNTPYMNFDKVIASLGEESSNGGSTVSGK